MENKNVPLLDALETTLMDIMMTLDLSDVPESDKSLFEKHFRSQIGYAYLRDARKDIQARSENDDTGVYSILNTAFNEADSVSIENDSDLVESLIGIFDTILLSPYFGMLGIIKPNVYEMVREEFRAVCDFVCS